MCRIEKELNNLENFVTYDSITITFVSTLCDYFVEGACGGIKIKSMRGKICVLFHNIPILTQLEKDMEIMID